MKRFQTRELLLISIFLAGSLVSLSAPAGGISLGGTRLIYPADARQTSIAVRNTSSNAAYLVQSWTESANGQKSTDFIVTPPLFVSNSGDENLLNVMFSGPVLPNDRETLYYFNSRAIPSVDKSKTENKSVLMLATTTRIKLFVRPSGLTPTSDKASDMLQFSKSGNQLTISNPSPYYITLVQMKVNGKKISDVMVPPKDNVNLLIPSGGGDSLSYSTMNDYGGTGNVKVISLK
ncbi:fimbria/pilus periplasmic chaperone [Serratia grimesii]|uniref:fimbria/pilus periplasmic chaperone n=1 Tax=Serratia grimesii TaxID=82995 RepID=UPI0039AF162D